MGREPFLEGSRVDFLCTQLCYIWFDRVLDGGRCLWWVAIMDRGLAIQKRLKKHYSMQICCFKKKH